MKAALLGGLFDYAGMFPPASLSLDDALAESARFSQSLAIPGMVQNDIVLGLDAWRSLDDAAFARAGFTRPCHICVVGVEVDDAAKVLGEMQDANDETMTASPPRAATTLEMHFGPKTALGTVVGRITAARHKARGSIALYIEPKWDDATWNERLDDLMDMFDALNADVELAPVGLKFRAWGDTALRPATVARLLPEVVERAIPLKATQGLHHPLVEGHDQNVMGFLGVLCALRLLEDGLEDVEELLTCSDATQFDLAVPSWKGRDIPIKDPRVPFAIGSCSLAEPDADLLRLFGA